MKEDNKYLKYCKNVMLETTSGRFDFTILFKKYGDLKVEEYKKEVIIKLKEIKDTMKEYYNESRSEFFTEKTAEIYNEFSKEIESKDYDNIINFFEFLISKLEKELEL